MRRESYTLDLGRLDSSKPSAVPEGEPPPLPPLQESGVVGLHRVESFFLLWWWWLLFLRHTASHLDEDAAAAVDVDEALLHGSLSPHRGSTDLAVKG